MAEETSKKFGNYQREALADLKGEFGEDAKFSPVKLAAYAKAIRNKGNVGTARTAAAATMKKKVGTKTTLKRSSAEKRLSLEEKRRLLKDAGLAKPNAIDIAAFGKFRKNMGSTNAIAATLRAKNERTKTAKARPPSEAELARKAAQEELKAKLQALKNVAKAERVAAKTAKAVEKVTKTSDTLEKCIAKCQAKVAEKEEKAVARVVEKGAKKAKDEEAYEAARGTYPSPVAREELLGLLEANGLAERKIEELRTTKSNKFAKYPQVQKWIKLKRTKPEDANVYYAEKVKAAFGVRGGARTRRRSTRRNRTRRN